MRHTPESLKRTPNGAISAKPIALRLMPDELDTVKTLAEREQRSMAAVCRLVLLRGLSDLKRDPAHRLIP